jgi:UDP-N-acetylmuramoyl-L-alanyl-D-glutamate--2,6-diaminopimelate ligase
MIKLSYLLGRDVDLDIDIAGVTSDSRSVRKGFMFVAIKGQRFNGTHYIGEAIEYGATAIMAPMNTPRPSNFDPRQVQWFEGDDTRKVLAHVAARFYNRQPDTIVAVTGTNGKTSTVNFVRQFWKKMGVAGASLGTLGLQTTLNRTVLSSHSLSMTTPDPVILHQTIDHLVEEGINHLAIEASSHGLDQYRLHALHVSAAGFTNLTRDHLDYHVTMNNYRAAKMKLFSEVLDKSGTAIVNADTEESHLIREICDKRGIRFWGYGYNGSDLRLLSRTPMPQGQKVHVQIFGQEIEFNIPLVGEFQLMNILCAAGMVLARKQKSLQEVIDIIPKLEGVAGRLQLIDPSPTMPAVYVDYAHTPDALSNVLKALRPHTQRRLICVLGCGGNRDKGKRPIMGQIASQESDYVIVTDDNPRHESASDIRTEILSGTDGRAIEISDRREAIRRAIQIASVGDVVLIAGKGHEQGQIIGDDVHFFDDTLEAKEALTEMKMINT